MHACVCVIGVALEGRLTQDRGVASGSCGYLLGGVWFDVTCAKPFFGFGVSEAASLPILDGVV